MPSQSYGEAGSGGSRSGTVPFGEAQGLKVTSPEAPPGAQGPQRGTPQSPAAPAPAQRPRAGGPDAQPVPDSQPAPDATSVFRFDPANYPIQDRAPLPVPWREQLQIWAAHPQAGAALRRLAMMAREH